MRERGLLVKIKEDTQSNVIDSHTPGGANTITWKRQKDELFQYKSQTIWKIDNLFFLFSFWKYQTLLRTKKWRNEKKTILPLMKRNDLAPTKWCWKPNLVQWFHSFENGILRIWLFRPLIYYLIKCRKTTNDNLSTSFKQRIFHFALLIHLFDLQTKTIFNSNFAVYLCGETIIHGKRSLLRMIFQRNEQKWSHKNYYWFSELWRWQHSYCGIYHHQNMNCEKFPSLNRIFLWL